MRASFLASLLYLSLAVGCAVADDTASPEDTPDAAAADASASARHNENVCGFRTTTIDVGAGTAVGPFSAEAVRRVRDASLVFHWNTDVPRSISQRRFCTGVLIGPNLLASARHCVDPNIVFSSPIAGINSIQDVCAHIHLDAGFFRANGSGSVALVNGHEGTSYACEQVISEGVGSLDVVILRLRGSPGSVHGWLPLSSRLPAIGTPLLIIGAPAGLPLQASFGNVLRAFDDTLNHDCDTVGGFSGAALVSLQMTVVGIHRDGGACSESHVSAEKSNIGTPMSTILDRDPTLRQILPGGRCSRLSSDCLCRAGGDGAAQGRCYNASLDCQGCVISAITACCTTEAQALQSCIRTNNCTDDACTLNRCGPERQRVNTCWSTAQTNDLACLGSMAACFGVYPYICS